MTRLRISPGLLVLAALVSSHAPAEAATFGVPTRIGTDGRVCTANNTPAGIGCTAAALDPPGYLILTGVDDVDDAGDTVHQTRFFIEVTGTTLDIRVFDAGRSGSRDEELSGNTTFTYSLRNPAGAVLKSIAVGADTANTENRVARMSSAAGDTAFVALSAGTAFTVTPGLYELRVTASGGGSGQDDRNSFGVDIRSGTAAAAAHYNAYTYGLDDDAGQGTAAAGTDTSLIIGALETDDNGDGSITQDMIFYPYVTRGCSLATSSFDMDSQAGASTSVTDTRAANTALTVSGGTTHSENTVTIHATTGVQNDVNNYGLYALQNDTGSQYNIIDWRIADFRGWADNPALPRDTTDALRTFLPNGYTGGVPPLTNATAPAEPVLVSSYAYVSGRNPPAAGFLTRFVVQVQLDNPGPGAIALNAANDQIVSGLPAGATNLGNIRCFKGTFSNTVGTAVNGTTFARCNFSGAGVTLNTGESALMTYQYDFTPAAAGTFSITNVPAAPASGTYNAAALAPNSTTWAQFSRFPTGGTVKPETLGPICDMRAATGTAVTRASLTGLRVDPSGVVEFSTIGQRRTAGFNLYATNDRSGRGPRTLLNTSPIVAAVPDALGPTFYRADTAPITAPYIQVEEIETSGRTRLLGPFAVGDGRLRDRLVRTEAMPPLVSSSDRTSRSAALAPRAANLRDAAAIGGARRASFVKVEVADRGPVRVPFADLYAMGIPPRTPLRQLHVTSQGSAVPFEIETGTGGAPEALTFYNPGLETAYSATNVFVVGFGVQRPHQGVDLTHFDAPVAQGSVRVKRDRFYAAGAPLGTDPWIWDFVVAGETWPRDDDTTAGTFDLPDLDVDPSATVTVRVRMGTVSPGLHTVDAEINGVSVGTVTFAGQRGATLLGSIAAADLHPTDNTLRLTYTSESPTGGLLYLGHLDIDAPAVDPAPLAPLRLAPYAPLLTTPRGIQYLVVTHSDFRKQANALASLKMAEGYRTAVVDAQQAYDAYSGGIVEARAIARLIADVARAGKLQYVLLMGDDSFDPLNHFGTSSASYLPSLYAWDDEFGRIPSEVLFADVNGDRSPDVAIGRLPVQTAAEATAVVAKIARQASTLRAQAGRQVFAVDNQGPDDPSFEGLAQQALARLPGKPVSFARIADGTDVARAALRQGLFKGAQATHFFGHGSFPAWADEDLLNADEVDDLAGSPETVVFAWACESQWFLWPFGSSLGEALVLLPHGGAVASFGPTGITDPDAQVELLAELYPRAFSKNLTLGEAIRQAKAAVLAKDPGRLGVVVHGFNLLGDPSLRLKP